jgi:mycothiol system anti-sigma-R factor
MINCKNCLQALNSYIDRELSDEDIVEVRHHLEACRGCLHLYRFEESVRRLVMLRCQEQGAPDSLRARITVSFAQERLRLETRQQRSKRGA